jgi:hypothetical protein
MPSARPNLLSDWSTTWDVFHSIHDGLDIPIREQFWVCHMCLEYLPRTERALLVRLFQQQHQHCALRGVTTASCERLVAMKFRLFSSPLAALALVGVDDE